MDRRVILNKCKCDSGKNLRGLNVRKTTGQDRIPPKLVTQAAGPLSHHVANIQCVDTGEFPDDAKLSEVVPLYKKDDKLNMKIYRSVSILPSMSKVLEKSSPSDESLSAGDT